MRRVASIIMMSLLLVTAWSILVPTNVEKPGSISITSSPADDPIISQYNDDIQIADPTDLKELFDNEGWQGDGSENDPYIIRDLRFISKYPNSSIKLTNIEEHLIIYNCTFEKIGDFVTSVDLRSCSNIRIMNCTFDNVYTGIKTYACSDLDLGNNVMNGVQTGISSNSIRHSRIENNRMMVTAYGIYCNFGNNLVILDNIIVGNALTGIDCYDVYQVKIIGSYICNMIVGISLGGQQVRAYENTVSNCSNYGIYLNVGTSDCIIHSNILKDNSMYAIYWYSVDGALFYDNSMWNSSMDAGQFIDLEGPGQFPPNNTINGRPIRFLKNVDLMGGSIPKNTGQLILWNVVNGIIEDLELEGGNFGLYCTYSDDLILKDLNISNIKDSGMHLVNSGSIKIEKVNIRNITRQSITISDPADNISLEKVKVHDSSRGITIHEHDSNLLLRDCEVRTMTGPLSIISGLGAVVENCTFSSDLRDPIYLSSTVNNKFHNNSLSNIGFLMDSGKSTYTDQIIPPNNTVDGHPVVYITSPEAVDLLEIGDRLGQILIMNVNDVHVQNKTLCNGSSPIFIFNSLWTVVENCTIRNSSSGIYLDHTRRSLIRNCTILGNWKGIHLYDCPALNTISNCNISYLTDEAEAFDYPLGMEIGIGIFSSRSSNVNIRECEIWGNIEGFRQEYYKSYVLHGNHFHNNSKWDVNSTSTWNGYMVNNTFASVGKGLSISKWDNQLYSNIFLDCAITLNEHPYQFTPTPNIVPENNTINGKAILYRHDHRGKITSTENVSQIVLISVNYINIFNSTISIPRNGAYVEDCDNIGFENCVFSDLEEIGIYVTGGSNIKMKNCSIEDCATGIFFGSSYMGSPDKIIIDNCTIKTNVYGMIISSGSDIMIKRSKFINNLIGFYCENIQYSIITQNVFRDNQGPAIEIIHPENVRVTQNIFMDNHGEWNEHIHWASEYPSELYMHDEERGKGNFWGNKIRPDDNYDGIVDEPYIVRSCPPGDLNQSIEDPYPLTTPGMIDGFYDLTALHGDGLIELDWKRPFYPDENKIIGYQVHSGSDPANMSVIATTSAHITSLLHEGLENGIGQYYMVIALYDGLEGFTSNIIHSYPDGEDPWVRITYPEEGQVITEKEIRLEWEGGDNSSGIDHYSYTNTMGPGTNVGLNTSANLTLTSDYDGERTYLVRCFDKVGRYSFDTVSFILDLKPPEIWLHNPSDPFIVRSSVVKIWWYGWDEGSGIDHYTVSLGSDTFEVGANTSIEFKDLANGIYDVRIRAFDKVGRSSHIAFDLIKDYQPPKVDILSPADGVKINDQHPRISWEVLNSTSHTITEVLIDNGQWIAVENDLFYDLWGLEEGIHVVKVRVTDPYGTADEDTVTFEVDLTKPEVIFCSPLGKYEKVDVTLIVDFSEKMDHDLTSIYVGGIAGKTVWIGTRLFFYPSEDLPYAHTVSVSISGRDIAGNLLSPFEYSFTTTDIGWIEGICIDESGNIVNDAVIELNNGLETRSDELGYYWFETEDGNYEMTVTKDGYEPFISQIVIESGETTSLDPILIPLDEEDDESKIGIAFIVSMILSTVLILILISLIILAVKKYRALDDTWEE